MLNMGVIGNPQKSAGFNIKKSTQERCLILLCAKRLKIFADQKTSRLVCVIFTTVKTMQNVSFLNRETDAA